MTLRRVLAALALRERLGISGSDVEKASAILSQREKRILHLRLGLHDGCGYTLEEVGRKFGLTRERIRQIEKQACQRILAMKG